MDVDIIDWFALGIGPVDAVYVSELEGRFQVHPCQHELSALLLVLRLN